MLRDKTVVLGVTGGIAVYKAVDLASKLNQEGATVKTVMTSAAVQFVTPLTFRNITWQPVVTDMFALNAEYSIEHVALAEEADIIVVAPATANTIAKLRVGMADNPLTAMILATEAPVVLVPAMNDNMYKNTATQENLEILQERGFVVVEPEFGRLASGKIGQGRFPEVEKIVDAVYETLGIEK